MDHNDSKNIEYIKNYIKPDGVLVDVGAHIGGYTDFFLSMLNEYGKIYSIELNPENFKILQSKFSNRHNVFLHNKAVYDQDGQLTYYKGSDSFTYNIVGHDMNFKKNSVSGNIDCIRLDSLLINEDKINLIKIDVEGAEYFVLKGLEKIIDKVENLLIECHLDKDWSPIYELLKINFDCFDTQKNIKVSDNTLRPYQCFCKKK